MIGLVMAWLERRRIERAEALYARHRQGGYPPLRKPIPPPPPEPLDLRGYQPSQPTSPEDLANPPRRVPPSLWQPIETAPRGEVEILTWDGHCQCVAWDRADPDDEPRWYDGDAYLTPTHWQPLPPPPTAARDYDLTAGPRKGAPDMNVADRLIAIANDMDRWERQRSVNQDGTEGDVYVYISDTALKALAEHMRHVAETLRR